MLRCFGLAIVACVAFLSTFAAGETNCALCRGVVDIAERILVLNTTTNGGKFEDIVRQPSSFTRRLCLRCRLLHSRGPPVRSLLCVRRNH